MKLTKSIRLFLITLIINYGLFAQDTLTVMHYNLLNYGLPAYGCDNSNNNPDDKDAYLRTITMDVNPDIFTVNELRTESYDSSPANRILENVLNIHFNPPYKRAYITNLSGSHIINMLYYNSDKLILYFEDVIPAYRDINVYKLYYKSIDLAENQDTAFITCIVTHLKSSQGAENEAIRAEMTISIMEYIETHDPGGNILMMGDFNVYTDQEEAFQNLVNPENEEIKFYDPVEAIGNWHVNEDYAGYHTQSTHIIYNDCASSGGMDDRFDFILLDKSLKDNLNHFGYVSSSYVAMGNDGSCFDQALLNCENAELSNDMVDALYYMSDHLPVILKLSIDQSPAIGVPENVFKKYNVICNNPVKETLHMEFVNGGSDYRTILLLNMCGNIVLKAKVNSYNNTIPLGNIKEGLYILRIVDTKGWIESKIIVIL